MKMFLQNASFFAKCKLHLARFAVDQTADAVGKRGGFMQFPMLWSECPDFVNAPPKLRFVARYVEKWFHCEVLLRQEEC
ncbi:hypothetical protein, partial [Phocaeicola vulgatus]|uniref:hypothetical protein n=1 Tax=Phocaeicola vulgatus TaxID=821 RepID=UPI001C8784C0